MPCSRNSGMMYNRLIMLCLQSSEVAMQRHRSTSVFSIIFIKCKGKTLLYRALIFRDLHNEAYWSQERVLRMKWAKWGLYTIMFQMKLYRLILTRFNIYSSYNKTSASLLVLSICINTVQSSCWHISQHVKWFITWQALLTGHICDDEFPCLSAT